MTKNISKTVDNGAKSHLFRDNIKVCPPSFFYFKLSYKQRENKIGERHSSMALIENAVGSDFQKVIKTGFVYANIDWLKQYQQDEN